MVVVNRNWTPETVQQIRKLAAEGKTASQIAYQYHCTRNAIIGVIHRSGGHPIIRIASERMHLTKINPTIPDYKLRAIRREAEAERKFIAPPVELPEIVPELNDLPAATDPGETAQATTVLDLTLFNCHWPFRSRDQDETTFCGHPVDKAPYCNSHRKLAYQPRVEKPGRKKRRVIESRFGVKRVVEG